MKLRHLTVTTRPLWGMWKPCWMISLFLFHKQRMTYWRHLQPLLPGRKVHERSFAFQTIIKQIAFLFLNQCFLRSLVSDGDGKQAGGGDRAVVQSQGASERLRTEKTGASGQNTEAGGWAADCWSLQRWNESGQTACEEVDLYSQSLNSHCKTFLATLSILFCNADAIFCECARLSLVTIGT